MLKKLSFFDTYELDYLHGDIYLDNMNAPPLSYLSSAFDMGCMGQTYMTNTDYMMQQYKESKNKNEENAFNM